MMLQSDLRFRTITLETIQRIDWNEEIESTKTHQEASATWVRAEKAAFSHLVLLVPEPVSSTSGPAPEKHVLSLK